MFKQGEIVYCIKEFGDLQIDTPYVVSSIICIDNMRIYYEYDDLKLFNRDGYYNSKNFISEKDYIISKRKKKIKKLKECLNKVKPFIV